MTDWVYCAVAVACTDCVDPMVVTPPSEIVTPVSTGVGFDTVSAKGLAVKLVAPCTALTARLVEPAATPSTRPEPEIDAFAPTELVHVPKVVP